MFRGFRERWTTRLIVLYLAVVLIGCAQATMASSTVSPTSPPPTISPSATSGVTWHPTTRATTLPSCLLSPTPDFAIPDRIDLPTWVADPSTSVILAMPDTYFTQQSSICDPERVSLINVDTHERFPLPYAVRRYFWFPDGLRFGFMSNDLIEKGNQSHIIGKCQESDLRSLNNRTKNFSGLL